MRVSPVHNIERHTNNQHGVVHSSNVFAAICVCDAVPRAMLQNFKQFNGRHGCGYCTHPGDGRGHARVYPITPANTFDERTHQETMQHVETVLDSTEDSVCGVKGPSPLILLPGFDIVKGVPPEYMHSVCLGVTKQMTGLWCDGQNNRGRTSHT
ncbi:uncharacterized protein [Littorina saxatilis]|uniref:uncharacterized protein n=1 Tax=Littorina saxatilis TaxID=31220 RepID=UPI0038B525CD